MPLQQLMRSFLLPSKAFLLCAIGLLAWCWSSTAQADNIQWSLGVNSGGYYAPQPGVSLQIGNGRHHPPAPQVVIVPPAPVYIAPAPVYVRPGHSYKPGRGHYRSPPPRHGHRHGHRHHHRHHDRD